MAKTENYTKEQTSAMVDAYKAAESTAERDAVVAEFADSLSKSKRSIIAKLSREGVYVAKEKVSKATGDKPEKKEAIVSDIAELLDVDRFVVETLEKANKTALVKVRSALRGSDEQAKTA